MFFFSYLPAKLLDRADFFKVFLSARMERNGDTADGVFKAQFLALGVSCCDLALVVEQGLGKIINSFLRKLRGADQSRLDGHGLNILIHALIGAARDRVSGIERMRLCESRCVLVVDLQKVDAVGGRQLYDGCGGSACGTEERVDLSIL